MNLDKSFTILMQVAECCGRHLLAAITRAAVLATEAQNRVK